MTVSQEISAGGEAQKLSISSLFIGKSKQEGKGASIEMRACLPFISGSLSLKEVPAAGKKSPFHASGRGFMPAKSF